MKYQCVDCGETFEEIKTIDIVDFEGYSDDSYDGCPCCESDNVVELKTKK